ncbi:MAG: DUF1566 domain-containing protein, partial [bacterium]
GVKCWGWNGFGQLGDWTTTDRNVPVHVAGIGIGVSQVAAGYAHTCALTAAGGVKCWGYNGDGRLGTGDWDGLPHALAAFAPHLCGNGVIDAGEQCDDGNLENGDGCSAQCTTETCAPVPSGLLGWWPGDGTAADISGNGRNGAMQPPATFFPGQVGDAFYIQGGGGAHVDIPDDPAWTFGGLQSHFSIELWVRIDHRDVHNIQTFVSHDDGPGSTSRKWIFGFDTFENQIEFDLQHESFSFASLITVPWNPEIGRWYHVALTHNKDTVDPNITPYTIYVDGVALGSTNTGVAIPDASAPLRIGYSESDWYLNGRIDEVKIYDRELTPAEVQASHMAGTAGHCRNCATAGVQDGALCAGDGTFCNGAEHCQSGACASPGDPCANGTTCSDQCSETALDCFAPAGIACPGAGSPCASSLCDGAGSCEADAPANAGVQCRASAGACDVAETCDGVSLDCPADSRVPAGSACGAGGSCAAPGTCDGINAACPSPVLAAGALCRAAAGVCDVADRCDGVSDLCPADAKSNAVCRPIGVVCDVAESCDGANNVCTADAGAPTCDRPVVTCATKKLKTSGKYGACRMKADAKAVKTETTPDYSKCDAKFGDLWSKAETKGAGACPSNGDAGNVLDFWQQCASDVTVLLGGQPPAMASAARCEADKLKAASTYAQCRLTADAKAAKKRVAADYAKCTTKLTAKWSSIEARAAGARTATGDAAAVQTILDHCTEVTVIDVAGGPAPLGRFVDNLDGTITDTLLGLVWEKKVAGDNVAHAAQPHEADNLYAWAGHCSVLTTKLCQANAAASAACTAGVSGDPNGCAQCTPSEGTCTLDSGTVGSVWSWLAQLNAGAGFDGQTDWRLPTVAEMESILDYGITPPPVDVAFDGAQCGAACTDLSDPTCSCTSGAGGLGYAAGVTVQGTPASAWGVRFDTGPVQQYAKDGSFFLRAVRGGTAPPSPRFTHNPDGTISDALTTLMWEPKVALNGVANGANLHDADNFYAWAGTCSSTPSTLCQPTAAAAAACALGVEGNPAGCTVCAVGQGTCTLVPGAVTTMWDWLTNLNAATFAGYGDWRLPKVSELETIADYTHVAPAVDPAFAGASCGAACVDPTNPACSCTNQSGYHTATTTYLPDIAWYLYFPNGGVNGGGKVGANQIRAVRTMP